MSVAAAQAAAQSLRAALLDNGVRAVSIELQPGVAGSGWGVAPFKRGMGHHIASRPSQGLTPGLALVKRGRSDLAGPLCNGYGGYDLTARIITLAWANHPGAGGPWSAPGWGTVPRDNGRPYIFGWEFEGGYEPYTDEMHDFMARCGAGTLDWLGTLPGNPGPAPLECWGEHKEPWAPGRKVDRIGYTAASGRSRIAAVRGAAPTVQEDDMKPLFIAAPGRGHALVWPGYVRLLPGGSGVNQEELDDAIGEFGMFKSVSTRTFDLKVSQRMNGTAAAGGVTAESTASIVAAVAKVVGQVDVDEQALGEVIAASVLPQILAAQAAKADGDPVTAEEVRDVVRGVFAAAAGTPADGPVS